MLPYKMHLAVNFLVGVVFIIAPYVLDVVMGLTVQAVVGLQQN